MTTVRESFVRAVELQLQAISVENGYNNDITGGILRTTQEPQGVTNLPRITIWDDEEKSRNESMGWTCSLGVEITMWAHHDPASGSTTSAYVDSLREDVLKALGQQLTVGTAIYPIQEIDDETMPIFDGVPYVGFTITPRYVYRLHPTDPTRAI